MGKIFAIKKYAIHDGPDIRTTVFFKGCPLSCLWCHNPEGISPKRSKIWVPDKCINCGDCIKNCPQNALSQTNEGIAREPLRCNECGSCLETCPALAHEAVGYQVTTDQVMTEIKKDIAFYDQSKGGVTFSGGEPLMQPHFLSKLLVECGKIGIHRAIDTTAHAETDFILKIADKTELFLIDLKHMDNDMHLKQTGVGNTLILKNIRLLAKKGATIIFRVPLIGGFNDDPENLKKTGEFILSLPGDQTIDLLPYHLIAAGKYKKLGLKNPGKLFHRIENDKIDMSVAVLKKMGLTVQVGG